MATTSLYFQCLIGMQCKDFTMVAADQTNTQSILVMKDDEDKLYEVSDKLVMGVNGDIGDRSQFTQFVAKNIQLYKMRNSYQLDTAAITHFTRKNMSDALHNGSPFIVNLLMAGFDDSEGGQLYTVDFLASCMKVPFAAHGFGGLLSYSILSNYYRPHLTEAQAYDVIKQCVHEIHKRLFMNLPNFCVKTVSSEGIRSLPVITPTSILIH